MFLLVRIVDNVIVGSANNPINVDEASKQGRRVYEIDDEDFEPEMIGKQITDFEVL